MRIAGLISGGKDSIYSMLQCIAAGHEIVALANIEPITNSDDMDSYMYQTVGHQLLSLVGEAISIPLYRQRTRATAICRDKIYTETPHDEVEDLLKLLSQIKDEMHIDGVAVGAIASDYQRTRVENVCGRLGLKSYAYLWMRDQNELLHEMFEADIDAVVIKVAAIGLKPELHLGLSIREMEPVLLQLHKDFGVHICGEGGEYETLTIDCPLYKSKINITECEKVTRSEEAFAPVGYLSIKNGSLGRKICGDSEPDSIQYRFEFIRSIVRPPIHFVRDCMEISDGQEGSDVLILPYKTSPELLIYDDSKASPEEKYQSIFNSETREPSLVTTFFTSSLIGGNTVVQKSHSTGWLCIGNVTASSINEGLIIIHKLLEEYEYELSDIVSVSLFVRDMSDWLSINNTYSQFIKNYCPPARSCVGVPLPNDVVVIMTVVAHRTASENQDFCYSHNCVGRDVVHVQSISHWAPANIGPYSQCVRIGDILYLAGQIPLIPGTMELLSGTTRQQCYLTLRHICRIIKAMNESYTMSNVIFALCFVTSEETAGEISGLWNQITKNEHAAIATIVVHSLPKNSPLEWQVLACAYAQPRVSCVSETVSDFLVHRKGCIYADHKISSVVCCVSYKTCSYNKDNITSITVFNKCMKGVPAPYVKKFILLAGVT